MIMYNAMYKFPDNGVHGEVLDFPGTITFASSLKEARKSLAEALKDMAETNFIKGEDLPEPDSLLTDSEADLQEPVLLPDFQKYFTVEV